MKEQQENLQEEQHGTMPEFINKKRWNKRMAVIALTMLTQIVAAMLLYNKFAFRHSHYSLHFYHSQKSGLGGFYLKRLFLAKPLDFCVAKISCVSNK